MKAATVNLFYDKRRDHNSLKLLVAFERKQRLYATGIKIDPATYARLKKGSDKPDSRIKDEEFLHLWAKLWNDPTKYRKDEPLGIVLIAREIANALGPNFTFEEFKDRYDNYGKNEEKADANDLIAALEAKADLMRNQGRINNGINYGLVAKSLTRFVDSLSPDDRRELRLPQPTKQGKRTESPTLLFSHVTKDFLTHYEEWMLHYGKAPKTSAKQPTAASLTTVGIYCRHLRAVFNDAIEAGTVTRDQYPFGKNRYVIPAGKNTKKALTKDDVRKLIAYACQPDSMEQRGRDLWVFSYYCNGMNMADICTMRWKDVDFESNTITFIRQKTSRSRKGNQTAIRAVLNAETLAILDRWGTQPQKPLAYVFPFVNDEMTAEQRQKTIQQVIKMTNKHVRRIAKAVGITADASTYAARHSFATILLQSEAPLAFISQSLGHTNIKTTENYLGSFDDEKTRQYLKALD